MNVFDEFEEIVARLEERKVGYALVGGVAMAFYAEPRFTEDIDLLVDPRGFDAVTAVLEGVGYFESATPWTFKGTSLTLRRFVKVEGEEHMTIDIRLAGDDELLAVVRNAVEAEGRRGRVRVARKSDLAQLKRKRNSLQDQADIERLEREDV